MTTAAAGCINDTKCIRYLLQSKFGFQVRCLICHQGVHNNLQTAPYTMLADEKQACMGDTAAGRHCSCIL